MYYCRKLKDFSPSIRNSSRLLNVYQTQLKMIKKAVAALHEDLQYDYQHEIENLEIHS